MLPSEENRNIICEAIKEASTNNNLSTKRIIIFGCTLYANDVIDSLVSRGIRPSGFIDNNKTKIGGMCSGLPVYNPGYVKEINSEDLLVIISSPTYSREMEGQLHSFGLSDENILIIPVVDPSINREINEGIINNKLADVYRGIEIYNRLIEKRDSSVVFVFPYPGTGDIYLACGFLHAYIEKHGINNPLLVVSKSNCKRVAELFGYQDISIINEEEMKNLLLAWQFVGTKKINIKPLLFWGWETKHYYRNYQRHKTMSFSDYFKYDVFDLDDGVKFCHPVHNPDMEYVEKLFEEKQIRKDKTIILAPYAGSFVSAIKLDEWERIAKWLSERDYDVCTNCYGEEEPIKDTKIIQFPYDKAVDVLEYAGGFIGVRSGLCDVISGSDSKMMIIYESNYLASDYEYFSLNKMGLNKNVKEVEYISEEMLMSDLNKYF
ncbi:MAG: hypothetical protein KBG42_02930 [Lachnospiraceae bacterium]|nr:hypothetical protein [Lachnospiraceae bacterium]